MTDDEFDDLMGATAEACLMNDPSEEIQMVFVVNDPNQADQLVCMGIQQSHMDAPNVVAQMDQFMAARPFYAALCTRVHWSPTSDGASSLAWLTTCVTGDREAGFLIKRDVEDTDWWRLTSEQVPWFALSTASALRNAIMSGSPLHMKSADKPDLFKLPKDLPNPAEDTDGLL